MTTLAKPDEFKAIAEARLLQWTETKETLKEALQQRDELLVALKALLNAASPYNQGTSAKAARLAIIRAGG